jgi:hypothetical protein
MAKLQISERRIAMLIDGDNAQYSLLEVMLEEASRHGDVTIRRAYGDWTTPNLANWRPLMLSHAIQPIQQWRYTTGKNATDSALIIDAMDILYSDTVQGFCIVSSDSDYTRLATRIRESGLFVMGLGHKKTPEAFINACNVFVYVENLNVDVKPPQPEEATAEKPAKADKAAQPKKVSSAKKTKPADKVTPKSSELINLIQRAIDISDQEDGWVHLGALGAALHRLDPSFDSRTYGHKTLLPLVKSLPKNFVIKGENPNGTSSVYVQVKG